eukprot:scaffold40148_cov62-Phaeocystis_antarctica.AAC.2
MRPPRALTYGSSASLRPRSAPAAASGRGSLQALGRRVQVLLFTCGLRSATRSAKSCDAAPRHAHVPLHVGRGVREEPAYTLTVTLTVS